MAKGTFYNVGHSQIKISARCNNNRVLATGLSKQGQATSERAEPASSLKRASENQAINTGVRNQQATHLALVNINQLQHASWHTGSPQCLDQYSAAAPDLRSGLNGNSTACRECCQERSRRNRDREVPWWGHQGETHWLKMCALNSVKLERLVGVVASEVNRFTDFGVAFGQGLARLLGHDRQ